MDRMNRIPTVPKGLYRHYKGGIYRVIGVGTYTGTKHLRNEPALVAYTKGRKLFFRDVNEFQNLVLDYKTRTYYVRRFERITKKAKR